MKASEYTEIQYWVTYKTICPVTKLNVEMVKIFTDFWQARKYEAAVETNSLKLGFKPRFEEKEMIYKKHI